MAGNDTQIILNTLSSATPWNAYLGAVSLTKLSMTINLVALMVAIVLAVMRRASGGKPSGALDVTGLIGVAAGIIGAAYCGLNSWMAARYSHVINFYVVLPSVIEAVYALLLGVLVWLVARIGNAGARRG